MKRIDLKIGFQCNNRCQFCVQGNKREKYPNRTIEEINKELEQGINDGSIGVVFTGGEPTCHPNIIEAVEFAKKVGYQFIQIQTNGRMFYYKDFCQKIIKAGANEFSPALHSSKLEVHDSLTQAKGSWEQCVQGIKNLKELNQFVLTNTVITSKNFEDLPALAKLLISLDVDQFQFAFVHILGTAKKNQEWLVPKKSDVIPFVKKALDIGIKAGKTVMTEAIPYCFMQGYEKFIAEQVIPETKVIDAELKIEDYGKYRTNQGKIKGDVCNNCKYLNICEGPWKEYVEIFGWEEFKQQ